MASLHGLQFLLVFTSHYTSSKSQVWHQKPEDYSKMGWFMTNGDRFMAKQKSPITSQQINIQELLKTRSRADLMQNLKKIRDLYGSDSG